MALEYSYVLSLVSMDDKFLSLALLDVYLDELMALCLAWSLAVSLCNSPSWVLLDACLA